MSPTLRTTLRRLVAVIGTFTLVGALVLVAIPSLADPLPIDAAVAAFGSDYVLLSVVGLVAFGVTVFALLARLLSGIEQAEPPEPEAVSNAPLLGSSFDDTVESHSFVDSLLGRDDSLRERLRDVATTATVRHDGVGRPVARTAVESGRWTDDDVATTFLATDRGPSLSDCLSARARGRSWVAHGARRSAREIVDRYRAAESRTSAPATSPTVDSGTDESHAGGGESQTRIHTHAATGTDHTRWKRSTGDGRESVDGQPAGDGRPAR